MPPRRRLLRMPLALAGLAPAVLPQKALEDPAPPAVHAVTRTPATARVNPALVTHAVARPLASDAVREDAPGFLGSRRAPRSPERPLELPFGAAGPRLLWHVEVGASYAPPAVGDGRLVHMHRIEDREITECLDPVTGALYWSHAFPTDYVDEYGFGNGPKCTPLIGGGRVITLGVQGRFTCFDLASGQVVWQRELEREFELPDSFFGFGSTPLPTETELVLLLGKAGGPLVAGFDRASGRLLWGAGTRYGASYASPVRLATGDLDLFVAFCGGKSRPPHGGLVGIDARTHAVRFEIPWRSRTYESVNAATPVVQGDRAFVSESYGRGGLQVRVLADGSARSTWENPEFDLHFMTPLLQDDVLYGFCGQSQQQAALVAVDWESGAELWRTYPEWTVERDGAPRLRRLARGSLLATPQGVLALGESGDLALLKLSREGGEVVCRATLFDAPETWTPPVLSHGLLYVRQNERERGTGRGRRLLCYDLRGRSDG